MTILLSPTPVNLCPQASAGNPTPGIGGALDSTFGNGGKVATDFFGGDDGAVAIAIQPDAKLVAVGSAINVRVFCALARYNIDGTLDLTFGSGGKVTTDFSSEVSQARAVAIQEDSKIVVAGRNRLTSLASDDDFALARYNTDGTLDSTFGLAGKVTTDFANAADVANGIAIQADGKIIAAGGSLDTQSNAHFALARYNTDGTLDRHFGSGGKVTTDFSGNFDVANAIAIQPDGKIVAAGVSTPSSSNNSDFALSRYNENGTLDTSFGSGGKVTTDFVGLSDQAKAIAIESDGKIVLGGKSRSSNAFDDEHFALTRYNPDGSIDTSFGTNGKRTTHFGTASARSSVANAIAIQTDGKLVAAGQTTFFADDGDFALARYNSDGSLDVSFGSGGILTTDFFGKVDSALAIAIQADNKIVAAGAATDPATTLDFALARYEAGAIQQPDFSLSFDSPTVTAQAGTKARVTVRINRVGGFAGNVTVSPPDASGGIKPKPADPITTPDRSASFKLKVGGNAVPGLHQLTFSGRDDSGRVRTAMVTVVVQ